MNRFAINLPGSLRVLCALALLVAGAAHAERADRDRPMHLEANRVVMDDARQVSSFEGRVQLTQGTLLIQADKIVVSEDAQGYQHLTATGHPAKFRQRYEGSNDYAEGYGERIEYDTRAESVDFFGQARVKRGLDEVSGAHINYSTKTEVFEVRGKPTRRRRRTFDQQSCARGDPAQKQPACGRKHIQAGIAHHPAQLHLIPFQTRLSRS